MLDTWSAVPCGLSQPWAGLICRDLEYYYPSVLVTGRDIIFWVARMIFSVSSTGQYLFTVNIHGLILDGQGRKMSKSRVLMIHQVVGVTELILRFSMITGAPGNDVRFNWEKVSQP